jgi:hypothetical protein
MMSFLRRFFGFFGTSRTVESLPNFVDSAERIARFVFQSNHVDWHAGRLKPAALMPERTPGPFGPETSVCRTVGLTVAQIWDIGKDLIGRPRGKHPIGRGDFDAQNARDRGLDVVAEKKSFEHHALLIKWPADKEDKKAIALELSRYTVARKPMT